MRYRCHKIVQLFVQLDLGGDKVVVDESNAEVARTITYEDERVRLWVDNSIIIDQWTSLNGTETSGTYRIGMIAAASPAGLRQTAANTFVIITDVY